MAKRRQIRLPTRAERYWAKAPLPAVVKSVSTFGNENGPSCNELTGPNLTSDAPPEPYTLVYVPANHGGCIAALALANGPLKSDARPAPVSMIQDASVSAILQATSGLVSSNASGSETSPAGTVTSLRCSSGSRRISCRCA